MTNETKGFLSLGYWNRQKELLDEAHSLHRANRAVREAKDAAAAHGAGAPVPAVRPGPRAPTHTHAARYAAPSTCPRPGTKYRQPRWRPLSGLRPHEGR